MAESSLAEITEELGELEAQIREMKRRLPAHSVKPPLMMELLDLEDRRDLLLKKLGTGTGTSRE
jgi:hypothetical protein